MKHVLMPAFVPAVALAALVSFTLAEPAEKSLTTEAEPRFDYHDDRDSRNLAEVTLTVRNQSELPTLEILISAVGPNVDPIPGYRGVHGANRYTAEEIELILSGGHNVSVETSHPGVPIANAGSVRGGRRQRIPQRRLLPNGRIDFLATTRRVYPVEVALNTGPIQRGTNQTEVVIDGIPRMRITFEFDGQHARITGFESVGDPEHSDASHHTADRSPSPFAALQDSDRKEKPLPPPITKAEWDGLDNEGKWVRFKASVDDGKATGPAWVAFLVDQKDYEFLEWVGIYRIDAMKQFGVGRALAKANAPQWVRASAWARSTPQSLGHGEAQSRSLLRSHDPKFAFSWLEKHKEQVVTKQSPALLDYNYLKKKKYKLQDVSSALPPLKPEEVLAHLDAPKELAEFGDRKKAQAGKVYRHQVLRAIDAFAASGRYFEPWIGKVMALTKHPDLKVRQAALLSVSYFYRKYDRKKYPLSQFVQVADDPDEPAAIRESAFLVYSYFGDPEVWLKLHTVALQTKHPGWRTAVSQLGNRGTSFTLDYLLGIDETELLKDDVKLLTVTRHNLETMQKRFVEKNLMTLNSTSAQRYALERVAWAELTESPLAEGLKEWTIQAIAAGTNRSGLEKLKKLSQTYEPAVLKEPGKPDEEGLKMLRRVRALAAEALSAAE